MRTFLAFLCLGLVFALPAAAVDLVTNGVVDIIEGITLTQTTSLNFGVIVLNNGVLVVSAADGTYTDASNLVYDNTNISQAILQVDSNSGVDITVNCTAGAMPAGLLLGSFTADWADAGAEGVHDAFPEAVATVGGEDSQAKDGTVGGDQRQEDPQRLE